MQSEAVRNFQFLTSDIHVMDACTFEVTKIIVRGYAITINCPRSYRWSSELIDIASVGWDMKNSSRTFVYLVEYVFIVL